MQNLKNNDNMDKRKKFRIQNLEFRIKEIILIVSFLTFSQTYAQIEHVTVAHPVYDFLIHSEAVGLLPHFSSSELPLQRKEIVKALKTIKQKLSELSTNEKNVLEKYLIEFDIRDRENAVVIYSESDKEQVFGLNMLSDKEKYIYRYYDSSNSVNIKPLGSVEYLYGLLNDEKKNVGLGNLGFRLYGSLGSHFGYYLQATNGVIINGDREFALDEINKLQQNVKFADLNSDFDFSESHIRFDYDWFYATIGRETRLLGSGVNNRLFVSANAPSMDAINLGAKFQSFEYRFTHGSLLAVDNADISVGFNSAFPSKYLVMHRFAFKPEWGEIAFWEGIIYSKRNYDIAYLNPLSFFKSLEHALHDRDNSMMGGDITIRPFDRFQLKGSFFLDDIKFDEIGKGYWSNKTAWNIGLVYASPFNFDIGIDYIRVEPYTFTHFDSVNSYTNDEMLIGTGVLPNSDELSLIGNFWWGGRYPIKIKYSYGRHGANEYDSDGKLQRNVGGDPLQTRMPDDSYRVTFLDGNLREISKLQIEATWEFIRGFNLKGIYSLRRENAYNEQIFRLILMFEDF